jgi:hypothetical protein
MDIDVKLAGDLGVALNEASLAGLEYSAKDNVAAATFVCLTLPADGPEPADSRRQFIFHRVGRIAASLRLGRWDDVDAAVEPFQVSDLLPVVQSFGWSRRPDGWRPTRCCGCFLTSGPRR